MVVGFDRGVGSSWWHPFESGLSLSRSRQSARLRVPQANRTPTQALPVKVQKQKKARIEDSKKYNKTNKKGSSLRREVRDCGFLGYGLNTVGHRGLFL